MNRKRREIQDFPGILLMAGNNSSSRLSSGHSSPGGKVAAFKMCKPLCLCSLCEPARVAGDLSPGVGTGGNWCRGQCGGSPSLGQGLLHLPGGHCHLVLIKST